MVSLQAESTYWFHYDRETPPEAEYVPASIDYPLSIGQSSVPIDRAVHHALFQFAHPIYYSWYTSFPKQFSKDDHYTLFVPYSSVPLEHILSTAVKEINGNSFRDRDQRLYQSVIKEGFLLHSMSRFYIQPFEIKDKWTRITTLFQPLSISPEGKIDQGATITHYQEYDHAILYFYEFVN